MGMTMYDCVGLMTTLIYSQTSDNHTIYLPHWISKRIQPVFKIIYKSLNIQPNSFRVRFFCSSLSGIRTFTVGTLQHRFAQHNDKLFRPLDQFHYINIKSTAVVVVIAWQLDLQLPMQSVLVVSLNPTYGKVYSIQHYVIKFVSDLRQVGGFLRFPPSIKLTHDIIKILLKVALNTITLILYHK